jgi:alkylation response protein AidB-like acyl-CoA dehydrogenase
MDTALDFSFNEDQEAVRSAIKRFCTQQNVDDIARQSGAPFPRTLWRQLAELGIFYPASADNNDAGAAVTICAISETLGESIFPGPIAATYLAVQVATDPDLSALLDGQTLVSLSNTGSTLLPWGTEADLFLVTADSVVSRAAAPQEVAPVSTLGGETWGRQTLHVGESLPNASRGLALCKISTAGYLAGIAWRLLREASEFARTRRQFGKALGDFQAVAHPLADCAIALTAAQSLARSAACAFDSATDQQASLVQTHCYAAGAIISARRASLKTAFACHQVYAGIGITLDGPAFHLSRRIRQVASQPPFDCREQDLILTHAGLGV